MEDFNVLYEWTNKEYKEKRRNVDWFWALGIIAIAGSVAAFIFSNFLFGVFILLAAIVMIFMATQKPKDQKYTIIEEGIIIDETFFDFDDLKGFWLDDSNDEFKLLLHTKQALNPVITVYFDNEEQGDQIFTALSSYVEETPLAEPVSHQIMERLGF